MNSTQLKCFISLAKTLNFTKAAREMFLSQSAVSKNIKNLEKELKVSLFDRTHHKVALTRSGQIFYNHVSLTMNETENVISNLRQGEVTDKPKIKMGYTDLPFEKKWLPIALNLINTRTHFELIPYFVDPGHEKNISKLLTDKTIDFMMMQKDVFMASKNIHYERLFEKGFSVVVLENDPLFLKQSINFQDLSGRDIYLWNGNDNFPSIESLKYSLSSDMFNINFKEESDTSTLIAYVRAKMGIGIVPSVLYNKADTDLRYIPLNSDEKLSYGMVFSENINQPEVMKDVSRFISLAVRIAKVDF
ncbi:LysR family transcriptional regulator [Secundilactobacillus pentosiphilus]|uniref:LysR family transcriptional regulator n=1 Tax=Secundilactobacillus pentosiphilus TaxID=1714682 RepID=A0A1Z5IX15_9LACO|nr:LysR family transcriptional regulator [Secundilactobacillus pentosiphilus]GAX06340.1 LysR family transcriptional regulator [Secundilactobacillus pentosiphilus]